MNDNELAWGVTPGIEKSVFKKSHSSGEVMEIPVARITGESPGPTFVVMSGMHAGEYSGILAAQKLVQT